MLVIRQAQMDIIATGLAEDFRQTLGLRIAAILRERGGSPARRCVDTQVERALDWSSRLRLLRSQTEQLAEVMCRKFGGFPEGPLPKPAMKVLYARSVPVEERLRQLEILEI